MAIDAVIGYPDFLYRLIRHPVVWCGAIIAALDRFLADGTLVRDAEPGLYLYQQVTLYAVRRRMESFPVGEQLAEASQLAVLGTEIVPPLTDAVGLVHGDEAHVGS